MHLTGSEITGASSVVAALAIIGGYLGVRSANQNALKIAREERTSKRQDELDALKRATYADYQSKVNILATLRLSSLEDKPASRSSFKSITAMQQCSDADIAAFNVFSQVKLLASQQVIKLAFQTLMAAGNINHQNTLNYTVALGALQTYMRHELDKTELPSAKEIDQLLITLVEEYRSKRAPTQPSTSDK